MAHSYQNRLTLQMFSIILIPVTIISLFILLQNIRTLHSNTEEIAGLYLQEVSDSVDREFTSMYIAATAMIGNDLVKQLVSQDPDQIKVSDYVAQLRTIDTISDNTIRTYGIYNIRIYVDEKYPYSKRGDLIFSISDLNESMIRTIEGSYSENNILKPYEFSYAGDPHRKIISCIIPLRKERNFDEIIGYVSIDILEEAIIQAIQAGAFTENSMVSITDSTGEAILSVTKREVIENDSSILEEGEEKLIFGMGDVIRTISLINGWQIRIITPMKDIIHNNGWTLISFGFLILLALICVFFTSRAFAKKNAEEINALSLQISRVENGDLSVRCEVKRDDEIGELQMSFNYMVDRIASLLEKQSQLGKELNEMELSVLQAQINPHFLYNTLDIISWAAKKNNTGQVVSLINELSRYYRISLGKGKAFIRLSDEVEHSRLYVDLYNAGKEDKIDLQIRVNEIASQVKILKFILQPLVENCVLHAFSEGEYSKRIILLTVEIINNNLIILIEDNGIGMSRSKRSFYAEYLKNSNISGYAGGYGITNVIRRLKLYYEEKARIGFFDGTNGGTRVVLEIPYDYTLKD